MSNKTQKRVTCPRCKKVSCRLEAKSLVTRQREPYAEPDGNALYRCPVHGSFKVPLSDDGVPLGEEAHFMPIDRPVHVLDAAKAVNGPLSALVGAAGEWFQNPANDARTKLLVIRGYAGKVIDVADGVLDSLETED